MTFRERARLAHDVGKYIARTARNLPPEPTSDMIDMLARDLYDLRPGQRASAVFAALAKDERDPMLDEVRALLLLIDDAEHAVRAGERQAVTRAARAACAIDVQLRALLGAA